MLLIALFLLSADRLPTPVVVRGDTGFMEVYKSSSPDRGSILIIPGFRDGASAFDPLLRHFMELDWNVGVVVGNSRQTGRQVTRTDLRNQIYALREAQSSSTPLIAISHSIGSTPLVDFLQSESPLRSGIRFDHVFLISPVLQPVIPRAERRQAHQLGRTDQMHLHLWVGTLEQPVRIEMDEAAGMVRDTISTMGRIPNRELKSDAAITAFFHPSDPIIRTFRHNLALRFLTAQQEKGHNVTIIRDESPVRNSHNFFKRSPGVVVDTISAALITLSTATPLPHVPLGGLGSTAGCKGSLSSLRDPSP